MRSGRAPLDPKSRPRHDPGVVTPGTERLHARLHDAPWVVMDGALGTRVAALGYDVDNPLWGSVPLVLDGGPGAVARIHAEYVAAGAELVIANTHNASLSSCAQYVAHELPLAAPVEEAVRQAGIDEAVGRVTSAARALLDYVNRVAVAAARRAAGPDTLVAACTMSPDRPYAKEAALSPQQVARGLFEQVQVLEALDLDLLVFEMLSTDSDVAGVARLLPGLSTPAGVGLTLGRDGRTRGGLDPVDAGRRLVDAGASVVFVQCTPYDVVLPPLKRLVDEVAIPTGVPIGVYANDGRQWIGGAWRGAPTSPERYAEAALAWIDAGARIVGGCCNTDPSHIRALSRLRAAPPGPSRS